MTLGFSQQIKGVENFFVPKIWSSLLPMSLPNLELNKMLSEYYKYEKMHKEQFGIEFPTRDFAPKLHTIRQGLGRWGAGMDIHMVINNRTSNRFQFAPTIKCKSVQKIEIKNADHLPMNSKDISCLLNILVNGENYYLAYQVKVDGLLLNNSRTVELAVNDGFDTVDAFFAYFNKDFTGTLIHWTDLKY